MSTAKQLFPKKIIHWYHSNKRDLPWRRTTDPYKIWLSEIILQQTRVDQGLAYYFKFIEAYPTVSNLALADEQEVLKLWQGLGYYTRARNLHSTAKIIHKDYEGVFPSEYKNIVALKGIGPYSAAAIASFAFNHPYAVVDGNVYRVLSRVFGIATPIDSTKGKKEFARLAEKLLDKNNPGTYNQAIMEFGALQCVPANPECSKCPVKASCLACKENKIDLLPVKSKKIRKKDRYFNYFLLKQDEFLFLRKRNEKDIWKNLFELPMIETPEIIAKESLLKLKERKALFRDDEYRHLEVSDSSTQVLTHQKIFANFIEVEMKKSYTVKSDEIIKIHRSELKKFPFPKIISCFLKEKELFSPQ